MFDTSIYTDRRKILKNHVQSGIILFIGNDESAMNYPDNCYPFRQDSTFLYYVGLDCPGLSVLVDIDNDTEILFGEDSSVNQIVWTGTTQTVTEKANTAGITKVLSGNALEQTIKNSLRCNRKLHYLPQYRPENIMKLEKLTGIHHTLVNEYASKQLIEAVVAQRSVKSAEEIEQIEIACTISTELYQLAMSMPKAEKYVYEIIGALEGGVLSKNSRLSFPVIFSVGEKGLHNTSPDHVIKNGEIILFDSGVESPMHYASDITRTIPVNAAFTSLQKDIYSIVLKANVEAIMMIKPGISFKNVHICAARIISEGMKQLGFMQGDTEEAVAVGAHALFFPHGIGHLMGLDVHDMEGIGEEFVGYDSTVARSDQFGLHYLRFAKTLVPGLVLTVEPGIYFMPELICHWKSLNKFKEFINYEKVEKYIGLGGVRIEDDVIVTDKGYRILSDSIPKTVEAVENACGE